MPCHPIIKNGKRDGTICLRGPVYDFGGYLFEVHHYFGPMPMRRDNRELRVTIPRGFWKAWERFEKLSAEEREKYCAED